MAEIVQSLFGVTPQSYQQAQQQRADAQAFQYAQMSPFQQANYAIGRGANMLGGVAAGALGAQDPELQRITARQQIAQQINPNDPASIQQGIAAMQQAGDSQGAFMLQDAYRKLMESGALVGQREASAKASIAQAGRERVQGIPTDIQVAAEIANLQEQIGQFTDLPASPERDQALRLASNKLAELQRLTTKEDKGPGFGAEAERESKAKFGKRFAELTPTEAAVVNKIVETQQAAKTPKIEVKNVMPGADKLADVPAFRRSVQQTIAQPLATIAATGQALQSIDDSIATNNFVSFNAARTQLAKSLGDSQLSRRDIEQAGGDPSILGGAIDLTSRAFTSTPSLDTQKKIQATLQAIQTVARKQAQTEVDQQRKIALRSPGYNPESVAEALNFPELAPRGGAKDLSTSDQDLLNKYAPKAR